MTRLYKFIIGLLCITCVVVPHLPAQNLQAYTPQQAHAHNDYLQDEPFWGAYRQGFGSIEIDLILHKGQLFVAHDSTALHDKATFEALYFLPIKGLLDQNKPGEGLQASLQLLIDLKSDATESMEVLRKVLEPIEAYLAPKGRLQIVISGNVPQPSAFNNYPLYFYFDGRPEIAYTKYQLMRIALISQNFRNYSRWNGEGDMTRKDRRRISKMIDHVHQMGKPVRFWSAPDNINTWRKLMELHVDFLNTDRVIEMADYLRTAPKD